MTSASPLYHVFGERLRSELAFPTLPVARDGAAAWEFRVAEGPAPVRPVTPLSTTALSDELSVTIARYDGGLRVTYSDTGDFDLTDRGRVITWHSPANADENDARLDVVGTLLPLALHLADRLTLHGSAVAVDSGVIAFLAPSGFGKSTLAMSLAVAGATFVSDDAVPVRVEGAAVFAAPGVPSPRFRDDVFARFRHVLPAPVAASSGKMTSGFHLADAHAAAEERPLAAVYLLRPVMPADAGATRRALVPPSLATMELVRNAKLAKLLWADEAQRLLRLVSEVTRRVPVWTLEVPRDLELLPSVVGELLEWHALPEAQPA
ncbi:MAG TPA: hypothetical protein VL328_01715 [Gemmatimonadaceae bacterium]|nr:hypothetical protein [Gemmatimonadaceae bacterium]